ARSGRLKDAVENHLVQLVKGGKRALGAKIGLVVGLEVAVVVQHVVNGFRECVIAVKSDVRAESLVGLDRQAVVEGDAAGFINVALEQQRVLEKRRAPRADAPRRVHWSGKQVGVPRAGDLQPAGPRVAGRDGKAW